MFIFCYYYFYDDDNDDDLPNVLTLKKRKKKKTCIRAWKWSVWIFLGGTPFKCLDGNPCGCS